MHHQRALFAKAYGEHRAVGEHLGRALEGAIRGLLERMRIPQRFSSSDHGRYLDKLASNIQSLAPHLIEEMEGIAEGAGVETRSILMLNCLVELASMGCSVLGFADAPGGPLIAKTDDLNPGELETHAVLVIDVPGKAQLLNATWPGTVWGGMIVNEHGVGVAGASVGTGERNDEGIPANMVGRLVLEQAKDVDEVIELVTTVDFVCHPFNWVVADEERLVVVERSVYKTAVRRPEDGAVWATNHYLTPDLAELVTRPPEYMENSRQRYEKLGRLAREKPHTHEGAIEVLTDHSEPAPICRHGEDPTGMITCGAAIIRPRARVLWFAAGPPCENKLRPYQLQMPVVGGGGQVELGT